MKRINILGVYVDNLSHKQVIKKIDHFLRGKRTKSKQITTVNPEFIMAARKDRLFRRIINRSFIATIDGIGLVLAADYLQGVKVRERVTGIDLIFTLSELAAKKGYSIFFLGAAPGVAEKTATILEEKYPNLKVAGTFAGTAKKEDEREILQLINSSEPDILLVAYGAPKQDKWINRNLKKFKKPLLGIGIGGSFDYIAGKVKRAPKWIRALGLEWLYRLSHQPKRFERIVTASIRFPLAVVKEKAKHLS